MTSRGSSQRIIIIIDNAELALEIQRESEQDREDQFVLEQMIELDDDGYGNNKEALQNCLYSGLYTWT
jgi:hypothetical protein